MSTCYVLGAFPKVSETFVLGEILEMIRQDEDVSVIALRHPRVASDHPGTAVVLARTTYLPRGPMGAIRIVATAAARLVREPRRFGTVAKRAVAWAISARSWKELGRLFQACEVARLLPAGTSHLHAHFANGPASVAATVSSLTGLPYSFTGHARDLFEHASTAVLRDKISSARFVVAISRDGKDRLDRSRPGPQSNVSVIRNGIDLAAFDRRSTAAAAPTTLPIVLAVSRLVPKKGLDVLIEAIAALRRDGTAVACEIVGDGPLRRDLEDRARRSGAAPHVRFLGALGQAAVADAYARATLFALPCRVDTNGDRDGLPVSIVEALAAGLAVVTTPVGGIPELIVPNRTGMLVAPNDSEELAHALQRLLDDDLLRQRLARAGRAVVAREYERSRTVGELRALLHAPQDAPGRVAHATVIAGGT
jgi:glycosyltransferase involved in cell wall biosynthesis